MVNVYIVLVKSLVCVSTSAGGMLDVGEFFCIQGALIGRLLHEKHKWWNSFPRAFSNSLWYLTLQ